MTLRKARLALALGALSLVVLGSGAAPAGAALGISCPTPTSRVFLPWGDSAFYALAPDGGLEAGGKGWTLAGGARVMPGNEPFYVRSRSDKQSLSLPPGGSATTPPMCVGLLSGQMRFFAANGGASESTLKVEVLYGGGTGKLLGSVGKLLGVAEIARVPPMSSWAPSPRVRMLGGTLPLLTSYVQFRFTAVGSGGTWLVDDVYLDPLKHG